MTTTMIKKQFSNSSTCGETESRISRVIWCVQAASMEDPFRVPQMNTTMADEDRFVIFAKTLYALCKAGRIREAVAEAIDYFDDGLLAGEFRECDRALRQLEITRLAPSVMVSILGITIRARKLKGRAIFFQRSNEAIAKQKGKRYASELLTKYR